MKGRNDIKRKIIGANLSKLNLALYVPEPHAEKVVRGQTDSFQNVGGTKVYMMY